MSKKEYTQDEIRQAEDLMRKHETGEQSLAPPDLKAVQELLESWEWCLLATQRPGYTTAHYTDREFQYISCRNAPASVLWKYNTPEQQQNVRKIIAEAERCGFYERFDRDEARRDAEHYRLALEHLNRTNR